MNIIKAGLPPAKRTYQAVCPSCSTVFRFEKHEAIAVPAQRDGELLKINCPICKRECHIDGNSWLEKPPGNSYCGGY